MQKLERNTLVPDWRLFGLDSIQGYLELAEWYSKRGVTFVCDEEHIRSFGSMYFQLLQLEKDGLVVMEWKFRSDNERALRELKQIALTVAGRKLLSELKAKSRSAKLKERVATVVWAVVTSALTTLVVIALKGK
ncbi:hypothetical protein [Zoogloea sp.]|uniref:hypothetical protein n=1 Tax=Zoogloea sp. TaxID=49181 RepID=UPI0035B2B691